MLKFAETVCNAVPRKVSPAPLVPRGGSQRWTRDARPWVRATPASGLSRYAVYLVADDRRPGDQFLKNIDGALKGGVSCVELRMTCMLTREYVEFAGKVRALTRAAGVPLIIHDRVDVALAADAEGLHVGETDMPWHIARRLLGPDRIIGCSTNGAPQLVREALSPEVRADYIGSGAVFGSTSGGRDMVKGIGHLATLRSLIALEAGMRAVPLLAVGGVDATNANRCIEEGADGVAVVGEVLMESAAETEKVAGTIFQEVRNALHERAVVGSTLRAPI